jgi:hypothetical protein
VILENKAKEEAEIVLFVIDSQTRAIASMVEAVELIMMRRTVVLCVMQIEEGRVG